LAVNHKPPAASHAALAGIGGRRQRGMRGGKDGKVKCCCQRLHLSLWCACNDCDRVSRCRLPIDRRPFLTQALSGRLPHNDSGLPYPSFHGNRYRFAGCHRERIGNDARKAAAQSPFMNVITLWRNHQDEGCNTERRTNTFGSSILNLSFRTPRCPSTRRSQFHENNDVR
jgi:hypothetical protein